MQNRSVLEGFGERKEETRISETGSTEDGGRQRASLFPIELLGQPHLMLLWADVRAWAVLGIDSLV